MDKCYPTVLFFVVVMLSHTTTTGSLPPATSVYPYDIGVNMSPKVKNILVFLIFGMVFIAFLSVYLWRCVQDSSNQNQNLIPNHHNHMLRLIGFQRGLARSVINSFPVFTYSDVKNLKIGKDALECAVCISEFADDEQSRLLPKCHHVFHTNCIDAWLASHTTCPVCRSDLTKPYLDCDTEPAFNQELTLSHIENTVNETRSPNNDLSQLEEERATPKFPRSHSTGHSLVAPGESCERYTLHLPEGVEKQIVTLKRAKSCGYSLDGGSGKGSKWNPDLFCGQSELWKCKIVNGCVPNAKNDSVGKSDQAESSSSASLPV
ncbi:Zinc finger, RING/FYVE/PHD-type [Artemisia annua]|uniref:RING-type E3 ubiquitin transferase n=1 Tax=Artemisia annua TaxID=35608 RepID=A0A2U1QGR1_ARTAN|nr:Zinc finger, RING/FYVE/PHD-type [Artemisia annua]